jgi:putative transposase
LIFCMVAENPIWGAPRIHGELLMLGFDLSERTISRWMKRAPRDPDLGKRLRAFLRNHREAIAAMNFFTVPTITFGVLYCFFIISHDRRRILNVNVTKHPTSGWIIQQLREAFPFEASHKYLILDRDQKFGFEVIAAVTATRMIPKRTSFRSPWQNGIAERWVGSCRRDLLDHIVALNERHLRRLLSEYVRYHHEDRTHLGLEKETPDGRIRSLASGRVLSQKGLGGLHHRYDRAA